MSRLQEIRDRWGNTTSGKWMATFAKDKVVNENDTIVVESYDRGNIEFIAHAKGDIEWLLSLVDSCVPVIVDSLNKESKDAK